MGEMKVWYLMDSDGFIFEGLNRETVKEKGEKRGCVGHVIQHVKWVPHAT